ncbi:MAG: N-acyl-D-amino-acid deacylase family protein [Acidimicrobiales bacterium]
MARFDTLIRGGTVVDGSRRPPFQADVGITDGRIDAVGSFAAHDAGQVIDADSMLVTPGFIDLHTHYDSQIYWDPYCTISGWHGVTSVVIGNCGFGFAPCRPADQDRAMLTLSRNEAVPLATMKAGMPWDWETYPEFLDSLERTAKGVNVLSYLGLSPLMAYVMGTDDAKGRPATPAEQSRMCHLLEEAMDAGCCGFSAQVLGESSVQRDFDGTPMITDTMARDDLYALAAVLGRLERGFTQFMGGGFAMHEKVAEVSGRPVIYNLMAASGVDQHGVLTEMNERIIDWLVECNERGLEIYAQALVAESASEFTLEDWNLYDASPVWREFTLGDPNDRMPRLTDPAWRQRLIDEYDRGEAPATIVGERFEDLIVENQSVMGGGHTVGEIARRRGCHPVEAMLDVAHETDLGAVFATPPMEMDYDVVARIANADYSIPGVSDGGAHTKFLTLGAYTTEFLVNSVRDHEIMPIEDAIWRLSGYPAQAAGFRDRGTLSPGAPADVLVIDYDRLALGPRERAFDFPENEWRRVRRAEGYRITMVNGEVTFDDGVCTGATPGLLLRHGHG